MPSQPPRVRFAPSPTGPLHMGGVRTALYNYLFAKQLGGTFVLRIEDTDQTRFVSGAEIYIKEALEWCGLVPDESPWNGMNEPYRQSERKHLYRPFVEQLLETGKAYYAFDTAEDLENIRERAKNAGSVNWQYSHITRGSMKNSITLSSAEVNDRLRAGEPYVVRLKLNRNEEVKLHDNIRGWVQVNTNNLDDKVLFKSDGMPTYHLANVVDDHLMHITHVIRGEEWLPSAPLHVLLYKAFNWEDTMPEFAHLPLLLRPDGNGKLSKRDGDRLGFPVFPINWINEETGETASGYREMGFYPEAFINLLAFLGWNPGTDKEIYTLQELVHDFKIERVSKAGAKFDFEKAKWFNQQHLRLRTNSQLMEDVKPYFPETHLDLMSISNLMKERAVFPKDIATESKFFFHNPPPYNSEDISKKWLNDSKNHIQSLIEIFNSCQPFTETKLHQAFQNYLTANNLSFGKIGPALRIAISGKITGPNIFYVMEILGNKESISRMQNAVDLLP